MSDLNRFLEALSFPGEPYWMLFWSIPDKASEWVQVIDEALCKRLVHRAETHDVYVGCGFAAQNYGPTLRCPASEIAGIPGVWLDIDYGAGHKKPNLPPNEEAAHSLLGEMGLPPSAVVHSGRGLQAWWLFKEPWIFDTDDERHRAEVLTKGWSTTLRAKARAHRWDADQVGDLARVMRLPGLWNRKGVASPTRLLSLTEARYDPGDFDAYLLADLTDTQTSAPSMQWSFTLSATAEPPAEKFALLREIDAKFLLSWQHARKELQDQSASSYDLSLATRALLAGWTGQEVVNLLIAHRRKHGADLKLRQDYYERTLNLAAQGKQLEQRQEVMETIEKTGAIPDGIEADPDELFAVVSGLLGLKLTRFRRFLGETNTYEAEIEGRRVNLGQVSTFTRQSLFQDRILDALGVLSNKRSPQLWAQIVSKLFAIVENIETGLDSTDQGAMEGAILGYLATTAVHDGRWQDAAISDHPFKEDGHVWVPSTGLRRYITYTCGDKISLQQLGLRLTKLGCKYERRDFRHKDRTSKKAFWRLPERIQPSI